MNIFIEIVVRLRRWKSALRRRIFDRELMIEHEEGKHSYIGLIGCPACSHLIAISKRINEMEHDLSKRFMPSNASWRLK